MTNGNFADGVAIIAKHASANGYTIRSNHDEVFFGGRIEASEEDARRLESLGWSWDDNYESWGCFK